MFFLGILPRGAKLNIRILWGGKAITVHNGVWGYALPVFFWNLGALRLHLVPSGCHQGHVTSGTIFKLIYGDRDGNLSMLKGRLQVLKQDPLGNFLFLVFQDCIWCNLSIIIFFELQFPRGGGGAQRFQGRANAPPPPPLKKTLTIAMSSRHLV